jgi:DNA-binding transcriptional MocR family regulator
MRLNFSNATPEQIREGITRLGGVLHEVMTPLGLKGG